MITQLVHQLWPVLLDAAMRAAILLAAAISLVLLLRRSSPALRHLILMLALTAALGLPLLSMSLPQWRVLPAGSSKLPPAPMMIGSSEGTSASNLTALPPTGSTTALVSAAAQRPVAAAPALIDWTLVAAIVWLAGAIAMLAVPIAGTFRLSRLGAHAERIAESDWLELTRRLAGQLKLRRRVMLLRGRPTIMPMTWGIISPKILLPEESRQWPTERRSIVLLHELAHVKRWDCFSQWIALFTRAVYWFNPLTWLAAHLASLESERACDQAVLSHGARPSDYAEQLLAASNSYGVIRASTVAIAMARPSSLLRRIKLILEAKAAPRLRRWQIAFAVVGLLILTVPLVALRAQQSDSQTKLPRQTSAPSVIIQVAKAIRGTVQDSLNVTGLVYPAESVTIRPRVDGQIIKIAFTEGQIVQKGDLLVQIDPSPYQAAERAARVDLDADATVLKDTQDTLAHLQDMYDKGLTNQNDVNSQKEKMDAAAGAVARDHAKLDATQLNFDECTITSPLTGRIGLRLEDLGNFVRADDPKGIAVVNSTQPTMVMAGIAKDDIGKLLQSGNRGVGVPVALLDDNGKILANGKITAVDNQVDPASGVMRVKASFSTANDNLTPGQMVMLQIQLGAASSVIVPNQALIWFTDKRQWGVLVLGNDQILKTAIVERAQKEGLLAILKPGSISAGDLVVINPGFPVTDQPVKVTLVNHPTSDWPASQP